MERNVEILREMKEAATGVLTQFSVHVKTTYVLVKQKYYATTNW